jgi:hypothetical protein
MLACVDPTRMCPKMIEILEFIIMLLRGHLDSYSSDQKLITLMTGEGGGDKNSKKLLT